MVLFFRSGLLVPEMGGASFWGTRPVSRVCAYYLFKVFFLIRGIVILMLFLRLRR